MVTGFKNKTTDSKYIHRLHILILCVSVVCTSCTQLTQKLSFGKTYAEQQAGYSYIPVEPSTVRMNQVNGGGAEFSAVAKKSLLDALPDNSVRIATRLVSGQSKFGIPVFGADIGTAGNSYEIIIDFVNTQTVNKQFIGKWYVTTRVGDLETSRCYPFEQSVLELFPLSAGEIWTLKAELLKEDEYTDEQVYESKVRDFEQFESGMREIDQNCGGKISKINYAEIRIRPERFNIPVYVGIGLRLKANVTVVKGEVNLSSLPALTAAVNAGAATGTMSVQTIGITGKAARSNLLLLDKIDSTTIQNAIQVLASIKSSIESGDTTITPRIVGFHNTIGAGPQGVNLIHSLLASDNNNWLEIDPRDFATNPVVESADDAGED